MSIRSQPGWSLARRLSLMQDTMRSLAPTALAFVLALLISGALAHSAYQLPVQHSDNLDAMVTASGASSTASLFVSSLNASSTTLRPVRFVQTRWLMAFADWQRLPYSVVFGGVHAGLAIALMLAFTISLRLSGWTDLAAFGVAVLVLVGHHGFAAVFNQAYPINHFAQVALCVSTALALAVGQPRRYNGAVVLVMLVYTLLLIEYGVLVWVVVAGAVLCGLPGLSRRVAIAATAVLAAYFLMRAVLGVSMPGIGNHGSGFGMEFYDASDLAERFGAHPVGFLAYTAVGSVLSILFSEPRLGLYKSLALFVNGSANPVFFIHVTASLLTTGTLLWHLAKRVPRHPADWSHRDRVFVVCGLLILANGAVASAYMKDEMLAIGAMAYATAVFIAVRAAIDRVPSMRVATAVMLAVALGLGGTLWGFRTVGVHYRLRLAAANTSGEWVISFPPGEPDRWPTDPRARALTLQLRTEAIERRVIAREFLPRWAERYWLE